MTDETTTPPPERSWAQETGWPSDAPTPSWAEPAAAEAGEEQEAYDAWLEAQDGATAPPVDELRELEVPVGYPVEAGEPADELPDEAPTVAVPVVVPDALEAAATPLEVVHDEPVAEQEETEPPSEGVEPDEAAEQSAVPATRSATAIVVPLAVLVVLLAVATAVLGVASVSTRGGGDAGDARRDALAASRNAARLLFSYDYRHLEKDFAAGKAVTTGTFAADYARTTSKLVDDVAARYKAVVVAEVSDAGVVSASKNRVVMLVYFNQRSTSSLAAAQKITQSRVTMVMVRKSGRWLVSEVNAF